MSSTRQGAWSITNRVAGARLRGPSRSRSPSRARTRTSTCSAAATTSRSTRPRRARSVAGRRSRVRASARSSLAACSEISRSVSGVAGGGGCRPSSPRRAARATASGSVLVTCSSVISASPGRNSAASATVASHVSSLIQTSARIPASRPSELTIGARSPRAALPARSAHPGAGTRPVRCRCPPCAARVATAGSPTIRHR